MKINLAGLLARIKEAPLVKFLSILLVFNLIFASNYLFSSSDRMPGFPYRQDAYGYMLEATHLIRLSKENLTPLAIVSWFNRIYCGSYYVFTDLPLQLIYLPTLFLTDDFILAYKATLFILYLFASFTMYYLTYILTKSHMHCLVSTTVYVFSQVLAFEVFLGHLSMVFGYALIPLIVATYFKALWNRNGLWATLCGVAFAVLLIIRPDFGYFIAVFIILLALYFILIQPKQQRIRVLKYTTISFAIAFSLSFPFLNERYISSAGHMATQFEREFAFSYPKYSANPVEYLIPYSRDTNAYLGISVLSLSIIGFLSTLSKFRRKEILRNCEVEFNRFSLFLSFVLLVFFFLSLGDNTPLYGFLFHYVPFFNVLRVPTRWLIIAQLCLSILAGNGALFLVNRISHKVYGSMFFLEKHGKTIVIVLLACLILLDNSIYLGEGKKFHFTINSEVGEWKNYFFLFPPALNVPQKSDVYEYVKSDDGFYRILVVPNVYTVPYFYYIENLQKSNITFAYGYGYYPRLSLQEEIYQSFVKFLRNETKHLVENLGEKMFLLGIKYVIFQPNRLKAFYKLNISCRDLEYVTNDESFVLYRNTHFRNGWSGVFAVNKLNDSVKYLLSEENEADASVLYYEEDSMTRRLEVSTVCPCYIIMSQSNDDGWQVYCENEKLELKTEEYKGLSYILIPKQGKHILSVKFAKYWSSLNFSYYFYGSVIALIVTFNFILRRRRLIRRYSNSTVQSRR